MNIYNSHYEKFCCTSIKFTRDVVGFITRVAAINLQKAQIKITTNIVKMSTKSQHDICKSKVMISIVVNCNRYDRAKPLSCGWDYTSCDIYNMYSPQHFLARVKVRLSIVVTTTDIKS